MFPSAYFFTVPQYTSASKKFIVNFVFNGLKLRFRKTAKAEMRKLKGNFRGPKSGKAGKRKAPPRESHSHEACSFLYVSYSSVPESTSLK